MNSLDRVSAGSRRRGMPDCRFLVATLLVMTGWTREHSQEWLATQKGKDPPIKQSGGAPAKPGSLQHKSKDLAVDSVLHAAAFTPAAKASARANGGAHRWPKP